MAPLTAPPARHLHSSTVSGHQAPTFKYRAPKTKHSPPGTENIRLLPGILKPHNYLATSVSAYSISDLEQFSGIKAHTIRMWEQRYHLLQPARTATNIRSYSSSDLRRLLNVATLCNHGKRISQIASLNDEELRAAVLDYCADAHDYNSTVSALLAALLAFDEPALDRLFSEATRQLGFEEMMLRVAYPLLQRIGLLWTAGYVSPAPEHLLSHLLRQKMAAATEAQPPIPPDKALSRWVLFLPENEMHELALLFMNYVLRHRGHHTLYLGQDLPLSELQSVCAAYQPHRILSVFTTQPERGAVAEYATALSHQCIGAELVLYGPLAQIEGLNWPANCQRPATMTDFLALLETVQTPE